MHVESINGQGGTYFVVVGPIPLFYSIFLFSLSIHCIEGSIITIGTLKWLVFDENVLYLVFSLLFFYFFDPFFLVSILVLYFVLVNFFHYSP